MHDSKSDDDADQERWQVQLRKGALELVILAAVQGQPVYGLALLRRLQDFPSMAITEGTLYPLLDRLKREGLLTAEWIQAGEDRPRKYYQLSERGRQKLATLEHAWRQTVADIDALLRPPPAAPNPRPGH